MKYFKSALVNFTDEISSHFAYQVCDAYHSAQELSQTPHALAVSSDGIASQATGYTFQFDL